MKGRILERGAAGIGRSAASMASMTRGARLSILIFHRVLAEPDPLFPGELDARRFEQLMRIVSRMFSVLPLEQAVRHLECHELPRRALAITFDDGYADNHEIAAPILSRLGLSATVFVSAGFLDGGRMWNDTVIECLRRTTVPRLDLGEFGLPILPVETVMERRQAINRLLLIIKYQRPEDRAPMLERLWQICSCPALPTNLMMRSADVRALSRSGIGIGAHTVNHPILATLADSAAEQEISEGRSRLEAIIDAPVKLFAYPNGQPGKDFGAVHVEMAKRQGFLAAVTTKSGVVRPGDDLFQMPRFTPWDRAPWRWATRLVDHHIRGQS